MPELDLQRKSAASYWWIPLLLLLLALFIWWLVAAWDNEPEVAVREGAATQATPVGTATPSATATATPGAGNAEMIPVAAILANPGNYADRTVQGTARVAEVISDRGFWIEENGQRMFVVLNEEKPEKIDINAGQTVRLSGEVSTAEKAGQLDGVQSLEADTRQVLNSQKAFLYVNAPEQISIVSR